MPPVGRICGRPAGRGRQEHAAQVGPACYSPRLYNKNGQQATFLTMR